MAIKGKQGEFFDELEIMPVETRKKYLSQRLRQVVKHAYRNAPATREQIDRVGVSPVQIRSEKDLE